MLAFSRLASFLLCAACALTPAGSAAGACKTGVGFRVMAFGERRVAVWYPTAARPGRYDYGPRFSGLLAYDARPARACGAKAPLIVFSHGALGCGLQSVALTEELARNGFVVAAPDHADATLRHAAAPANDFMAGDLPRAQPGILRPQKWDESSRRDRRQDIEAIIGGLPADGAFQGVIDVGEIGLAGHSLGGYTVVGMAGGWPSWRDPRVRAVLALSPYVMPFQVRNTLREIHVPIMYQGGDLDFGITPFLRGAKGAYALANAPAHFVELRGAGHFAWVNCRSEHTTEGCLAHVANARLIADYGVAFFNLYLKGQREPLLEREARTPAKYEFKQPQ